MEINILIEEGFETEVESVWLEGVVRQVLLAEDVYPQVELSLVITGQQRIQELNRDYLGEDRPTDVLAFALGSEEKADTGTAIDADTDNLAFVTPPDGILHLGEVIISCPQAAKQAEEHHHPVKKEVAILIIHGVLHLLDYDHDVPELAREMQEREAEILSQLEADW